MSEPEKFKTTKIEEKDEKKSKIPPERIEQATNLSEQAEKLAEQGYKEKDEAKIKQAREILAEAYEMLENKRWGEWQELTDEDWKYLIENVEWESKGLRTTHGLSDMGILLTLSPQRFEKEIKKNPELKTRIRDFWESAGTLNVSDYSKIIFLKNLSPEYFQKKTVLFVEIKEKAISEENINLHHIPKEFLYEIIYTKTLDPVWFNNKWNKRERDAIFETATKQVFSESHLESFEKLFFHSLAELKLLNPERFKKSIPKDSVRKAIIEGKNKIKKDRDEGSWKNFIQVDSIPLAILQNDIEIDPEQGLIIHYPEKNSEKKP